VSPSPPTPYPPDSLPPEWVLEENAAAALCADLDDARALAACEAFTAHRRAHPSEAPLMALMRGGDVLAVEEVDVLGVVADSGASGVLPEPPSPTFTVDTMATFPAVAVAALVLALRQLDPAHPALRGTRECSIAVETLVRTVISALPEVATQGTRAKLRNALLAMGVRGL